MTSLVRLDDDAQLSQALAMEVYYAKIRLLKACLAKRNEPTVNASCVSPPTRRELYGHMDSPGDTPAVPAMDAPVVHRRPRPVPPPPPPLPLQESANTPTPQRWRHTRRWTPPESEADRTLATASEDTADKSPYHGATLSVRHSHLSCPPPRCATATPAVPPVQPAAVSARRLTALSRGLNSLTMPRVPADRTSQPQSHQPVTRPAYQETPSSTITVRKGTQPTTKRTVTAATVSATAYADPFVSTPTSRQLSARSTATIATTAPHRVPPPRRQLRTSRPLSTSQFMVVSVTAPPAHSSAHTVHGASRAAKKAVSASSSVAVKNERNTTLLTVSHTTTATAGGAPQPGPCDASAQQTHTSRWAEEVSSPPYHKAEESTALSVSPSSSSPSSSLCASSPSEFGRDSVARSPPRPAMRVPLTTVTVNVMPTQKPSTSRKLACAVDDG